MGADSDAPHGSRGEIFSSILVPLRSRHLPLASLAMGGRDESSEREVGVNLVYIEHC